MRVFVDRGDGYLAGTFSWLSRDVRFDEPLIPKNSTTRAAVAATDEALRIAGGPGFLAGRLERSFRDARAGLINPPLEDVALAGFGRGVVDRHRE